MLLTRLVDVLLFGPNIPLLARDIFLTLPPRLRIHLATDGSYVVRKYS